MEFLLKTLTPRNLLLAAACVVLFKAGDRYGARVAALYRAWRQPPPRASAPSADGAEIMARKEERDSRAVLKRYEQVAARLARARAAGQETARLEAKAAAALKLNTPAYRVYAVKTLTEVERDTPRLKTAGRPAPAADEESSVPPDVRGRRAARGARK